MGGSRKRQGVGVTYLPSGQAVRLGNLQYKIYVNIFRQEANIVCSPVLIVT